MFNQTKYMLVALADRAIQYGYSQKELLEEKNNILNIYSIHKQEFKKYF